MRWEPADESRHDDAPGVEGWSFALTAGAPRGQVLLTLDAARRRAAFVADFVVPAGRLVVADEDVPVPRPAAGLEVRTEGLWASCYCETPFEHWSLGLEAFGLRVEVDVDAVSWDSLVGDRLPVGFDLEWELRGPPEPMADGAGYAQPGVIYGELLVSSDRYPVDGPAVREHWWGGGPGLRNDPSPSVEG